MASLTITMLAPFGIRPKGTLAVRMLPLAQALVKRGHTVHIVAPPVHNPQDAGQQMVFQGVPVTHTQVPTLQLGASVIQQIAWLVQHVYTTKPNVIHLFKPKGYSGLAALWLKTFAPQIKLVVDSDDWEGWGGWNDLLPYPYPAKALFAWQEHDLPSRADAVTVASRTLQSQMRDAGVTKEDIFYLPNGITAQAQPVYRPTPSYDTSTKAIHGCCRTIPHPQILLLYTRFWEFDVYDVVAAFVAIVQHYPNVRLLVVGKGERGEEQTMIRLAQRAGISNALDYRGWVNPHEIPVLFDQTDVALVPMDDTLINRARCSVKLLEQMAAALPIVAGSVGQVGEYLENEQSGLLVEPGNPAALAQGALRLLENPLFATQLGNSASERSFNSFNWERLAWIAEQAYRHALA